MKFHIGSVTKLPAEWTNKFDFVNQRLLISALLREEWEVNLAELHRVMKPGGHLQICEAWSAWETHTESRAKVKAITLKCHEERGLAYDCGQKIPGQLTEIGFRNVVVQVVYPPATGPEGRSGRELAMRGFWNTIRDAAIKNGGFGVVDTEKECEDVFAKFLDEFEDIPRPEIPFVVITAQKHESS